MILDERPGIVPSIRGRNYEETFHGVLSIWLFLPLSLTRAPKVDIRLFNPWNRS